MHLDDFDFDLPPSAIATHPASPRDTSRLLTLNPETGEVGHHQFRDLMRWFRAGDALVVNDTRVRHARLIGSRESGGKVEALLLGPHADGGYEALVKPAKRVKDGEVVRLESASEPASMVAVERLDGGRFRVRVVDDQGIDVDPDTVGHPALPPYIARAPEPEDRERYQTVYAREPGAVAAPTAGLHFTPELLAEIEAAGVHLIRVLLHVGIGTFRPVTATDPREHDMEAEFYRVSADAAERLRSVRTSGGRVIAVGTTAARVLETVGPDTVGAEGWTTVFIYPPYEFRALDGLITNFHLPRSTLLMLVAALTGRTCMLDAYATARDAGYRFYSYGDAMFVLPRGRG